MRALSVRRLAPYATAILATVAMSVVIGIVIGASGITRISIVYLIVVLAIATRLGRGPAIFASLAAFLIYDWYFTEPYHQLTIRDADEWISLSLFLVTAVITAELAANERRRADEAKRREREAVLLFDALRLMDEPDLAAALRAVAERTRAELDVAGVSIDLEIAGEKLRATVGESGDATTSTRVLGEGKRPTAERAGGPTRWIRVVPPQHPTFYVAGRWRRYEIAVRAGETAVGHLQLTLDAAHGDLSEPESRSLALIASVLGSVAQRAELREATTRTEVLHRADELKTAMLGAVSHDLRTPLASIIASAGSLRQPDINWNETERQEFLKDIEREARRLSRIVDNLLDLSRMESGALRPERGWYDMAALIDDVLGRMRSLTVGYRVTARVPEDLPPVPLDYVEIDQVLSNLVENAVRHTPTGTAITVSARTEAEQLVIEVADDGPGIPAQLIERLFDPFLRGPSRADTPRGTGLGLAVARGLVEAHGGHVSVTNQLGGGAVFRFTLPLDYERPAPAAAKR